MIIIDKYFNGYPAKKAKSITEINIIITVEKFDGKISNKIKIQASTRG